MKLKDLISEPIKSYIYAERFVNNGSPSGFDRINSTSVGTRPYEEVNSFNLYLAELNDNVDSYYYGIGCDFFEHRSMIIHPDMIHNKIINDNSKIIKKSIYNVTPIAGARTVYILSPTSGYIKLNYDGMLGRVSRQLSKKHALSSIEITNILEDAVLKKKLPAKFQFLKESGAIVAEMKNGDDIYEWGAVYREPNPYPYDSEIHCMIPAFSLFANDLKNKQDKPLLIQMIQNSKKQPLEYFIEEIITPLLEIYFSVLKECGLEIECHSQNFLISIDKNYQIKGIVVRDLESFDKDISLCDYRGLNIQFESAPYKIITKEDYNYQIMHSFMYDFKLGEYFITPCIMTH